MNAIANDDEEFAIRELAYDMRKILRPRIHREGDDGLPGARRAMTIGANHGEALRAKLDAAWRIQIIRRDDVSRAGCDAALECEMEEVARGPGVRPVGCGRRAAERYVAEGEDRRENKRSKNPFHANPAVQETKFRNQKRAEFFERHRCNANRQATTIRGDLSS